jgi:uncharacterized protein (DUF2141 family)
VISANALEAEAQRFAADLTATVRAVVSRQVEAFVVRAVFYASSGWLLDRCRDSLRRSASR